MFRRTAGPALRPEAPPRDPSARSAYQLTPTSTPTSISLASSVVPDS